MNKQALLTKLEKRKYEILIWLVVIALFLLYAVHNTNNAAITKIVEFSDGCKDKYEYNRTTNELVIIEDNCYWQRIEMEMIKELIRPDPKNFDTGNITLTYNTT